MTRQTKIVATLGPASDDPAVLRRMLLAGVDVVRLNFSHGHADDHHRRAGAVRAAAAEIGRDIGILCDLQGPKIRIAGFADGAVDLADGTSFALDPAYDAQSGTASIVGCAYAGLPGDVERDDTLLLDDGAITLRVERVDGTRIQTRVLSGGRLSSNKGINKLGGGLSAPALTDKDLADIRHAVRMDADFLAVSFPRSADDLHEVRRHIEAAGGRMAIVAKIERSEALAALPSIIEASDAVMVARGDLGVEIGDAELPGWQKRIIAAAREQNRMVITATQMMESMIQHPAPTRAEVLDVANAVMDGTDAVMLSAETATGRHPVKVIEAVSRVCTGAERSAPPTPAGGARLADAHHFHRSDEAIARAAAWTATHMQAAAIIAITESGHTALLMSRGDTRIPIFALTPHERTRRRMTLCRGVCPLAFDPPRDGSLRPSQAAVDQLRRLGRLQSGQRVLVTHGDLSSPGGTNTMKILDG
ncbi:pyruvate kinase [Sinimarinibacterium flocculans]|uniref:Pyruvate kinase n=1 Tax=Sinimarinibacterium flocculans TaxID=985250 RepID=A0A318E8Q6_9GAMM|nr:pyruvate kinase [Sinimarinibacterium flocculans]PXV65626.1 pyruvate kinase [Sinimarinibacterium flocculans]